MKTVLFVNASVPKHFSTTSDTHTRAHSQLRQLSLEEVRES